MRSTVMRIENNKRRKYRIRFKSQAVVCAIMQLRIFIPLPPRGVIQQRLKDLLPYRYWMDR
eukprot:scaffold1588_cov214-Alexandrium_tamarense.AAC.16